VIGELVVLVAKPQISFFFWRHLTELFELSRITAQLIEVESGAHPWADHFDRSLEDFDWARSLSARRRSGCSPTTTRIATA
jgi:hypothetical protein